MIVAANPFGAKGNLVGAAIHDGSIPDKRGLDVIVHVLHRLGRNDVQHVIAGVVRIDNYLAQTVSAEKPPGSRAIFERAILQQLQWRGSGRIHHADVVHQAFAATEHPQVELVPLSRLRVVGGNIGHASIGVSVPA